MRDVFFFNDTATTEIYTLSLHDALPIFPVLLLLTGPLVVGDVETRALEDKTRPAGDLPLRLPAAHGALLPTLVVHRRKELLEHVPRRALVLVGGHRAST